MSSTFDKNGNNLIFLISLPRTGSTLLQRILFSHSEIDSLAEPWIMLHPIYALKEQGIATEYCSSSAHKTLHELFLTIPEGKSLYFDAIRDMTSKIYKRLLEISKKKFFLDKTPRYYNIIPELYTIYPNAHYIFLLRNPLAVLSSICKTWVGDNPDLLEKSYFKRDLFTGPQLICEGMQELKDKAFVIQYENLVTDPKNCIQNLCKKIGIEFNDQMINYGNHQKPKGTFGDPLHISNYSTPVTANLDKWIDHITSENLITYSEKYLEYLGKNRLEQMGYSFNDLKQKLHEKYFSRVSLGRHSTNIKVPLDNRIITVGTSIAPKEIVKQHNAINTWLNLGFSIISINTKEEIDFLKTYFPNIEFKQVDQNGEKKYGKPYIYINDIVTSLLKNNSDYIGIINSDILLKSHYEQISFLKQQLDNSLVFGSRIDVNTSNESKGTIYKHGYDFFFFNREIGKIYQETEFCIGLPWWDLWVLTDFLIKGGKVKKLISPFAYHCNHQTNYSPKVWISLGMKLYKQVFQTLHNMDCEVNALKNKRRLAEVFASFNKQGFKINSSNLNDSNLLTILKNFAGIPFHQYIQESAQEIVFNPN